MTALKPIENRKVRGIEARQYPLNEKCAHPECDEPTDDPHHIFPRSAISSDSWFVRIYEEGDAFEPVEDAKLAIPHVSGLCRSHHDAVEEHNAWIKLEEGAFVWYDRPSDQEIEEAGPPMVGWPWERLGPLDPQPPSATSKRSSRKRKTGPERRNRRTWSLSVPKDELEDGAGLLDDLVEKLEEKRSGDQPPRSPYYSLVDALNYTLTHADETDF